MSERFNHAGPHERGERAFHNFGMGVQISARPSRGDFALLMRGEQSPPPRQNGLRAAHISLVFAGEHVKKRSFPLFAKALKLAIKDLIVKAIGPVAIYDIYTMGNGFTDDRLAALGLGIHP